RSLAGAELVDLAGADVGAVEAQLGQVLVVEADEAAHGHVAAHVGVVLGQVREGVLDVRAEEEAVALRLCLLRLLLVLLVHRGLPPLAIRYRFPVCPGPSVHQACNRPSLLSQEYRWVAVARVTPRQYACLHTAGQGGLARGARQPSGQSASRRDRVALLWWRRRGARGARHRDAYARRFPALTLRLADS